MARGPLRHITAAGEAFRKVIVWLSADENDIATSPTITAGSGVPSASEPAGSFYLRTNGSIYSATDAVGTWGVPTMGAAKTVVTSAGTAYYADVSLCATGEADVIVGANLADAHTFRTSALTFEKLVTTTATPGLVWTFAGTGAYSALDETASINHATNAFNAAEFSMVQLSTARTAGLAAAVKADCTSLAGDTATVIYADFNAAAPTDGGAAIHSALYVGAGHDRVLDLTAIATGEGVVAMKDNLASGFEVKEATNSYLKFCTTDSAEAVTFGKKINAAASANIIADPGNAGAISVVWSGVCALTSAGAETRTLAIPTFAGQRLVLVTDTYVGAIVITSAQRINQAGNTIITVGAVGDTCELVGVTIGGALRWQVGWNDGMALS